MTASFEDLFVFGNGICHLRVYQGQPSVALAIEVEDNPGGSTINRAEELLRRIDSTFGGTARVFSFYPNGREGWTELLREAGEHDLPFRTAVGQAEIEELVGEAVPMPEPGGFSAATLGGKDHLLLALIEPEGEDPGRLAEMEVVAVSELPWAHKLSKCAHAERFDLIDELYEEGPGENGATGAHFFLSLGEEELAGCEYHRRNWISIAAASVELLERLDPKCSYEEVLAAASELLPPGEDREELCFLFSDPINWSPGEPRLTNGQHRTCALKAAGAPLCAVSTNRRWTTDEPEAKDPWRMAQSALASYWARRLGQS